MKKTATYFLTLLLIGISSVGLGQYKVTFQVRQPSLLHSMDHLYIAGNFNLWNPADTSYQLKTSQEGSSIITLLLPAGNYEYKFTRGNWIKVETDASGYGIQNRQFTLRSDTTISLNIGGWSDDFKANTVRQVKKHSASKNVHIMDSAFYMPELHRYRKIWIYLPADYAGSRKKYPVLYMHDGQNLFDNTSAYSDEWGVDEYLDSLSREDQKEVIVIAPENGLSHRMSEYNPWEFQNFGKGEGDHYVDFLVNVLKPYVDHHYRTLPGKKNTFIAGSSMGGLISLYGVLRYPNIFGGAGIFSPAFWTASGIDSMVIARAKKLKTRLFFYAGGKEGDSMVPDMKRIEKEIRERSSSPIREMVDPTARHNEAAWRKYFPYFYEWTIINSKPNRLPKEGKNIR